jgi:hypothetical protein
VDAIKPKGLNRIDKVHEISAANSERGRELATTRPIHILDKNSI